MCELCVFCFSKVAVCDEPKQVSSMSGTYSSFMIIIIHSLFLVFAPCNVCLSLCLSLCVFVCLIPAVFDALSRKVSGCAL